MEKQLEYERKRICVNGHEWTSPVILSSNSTNLSGEKMEFCPLCGGKQTIGFPAKPVEKAKYEIINHGADHSDYFPGCGTAFTDFDRCVTGTGYHAAEAYSNALEQIYSWEGDKANKLKLPKKPRGYGITKRNHIPANSNESYYWYVSIRYSL